MRSQFVKKKNSTKSHTPLKLGIVTGIVVVSLVVVGTSLEGLKQTINVNPQAASQFTRYKDPVFQKVIGKSNIEYGRAVNYSGQEIPLTLDIYQGENDQTQNRPLVLLMSGGGFTEVNEERVVPLAQELAKRGYVVANVSYRVNPGLNKSNMADLLPAIRDAQHDVQAAVRFFRKNAELYRINPEKIAVGGNSAGAITALYVGYNYEDEGTSGNPGYSSRVSAVISSAGAALGGQMKQGDAPLIMFHGKEDNKVPYFFAEGVKNEAEKLGIPIEFYAYQGVSHNVLDQNDVFPKIYAFLYKYLVGQSTDVISPSSSPKPSVSPVIPSVVPSPSQRPSMAPSPVIPRPTLPPRPSGVPNSQQGMIRITPSVIAIPRGTTERGQSYSAVVRGYVWNEALDKRLFSLELKNLPSGASFDKSKCKVETSSDRYGTIQCSLTFSKQIKPGRYTVTAELTTGKQKHSQRLEIIVPQYQR